MNIDEIRSLYLNARDNAEQTTVFYQILENASLVDELVLAYWASAQALKAKYIFNPFSKLSLLQKASQNFQTAIDKNPENIEIRFLRYTVEFNTPSFVGISQHLGEDKSLILEQLDKFDKKNQMKQVMIDFFEPK